MDYHIQEFYAHHREGSSFGNFHRVIFLHKNPEMEWKSVHKLVPRMSRGWYELMKLSPEDRVEFSREYWIKKLPYLQGLPEALDRFFDSLDDIVLVITQKKFDDAYDAQLIYSSKENSGFYQGNIPAEENEILELQKYFSDHILPSDFLAFLRIHNGFSKATDCTGIVPAFRLIELYEKLQSEINIQDEPVLTRKKRVVNPKSLIPFYSSFGMPYYQCFWGEWYPEQEMGNIYFGDPAVKIPDVEEGESGPGFLAFPTFLDWLMFYLDKID